MLSRLVSSLQFTKVGKKKTFHKNKQEFEKISHSYNSVTLITL